MQIKTVTQSINHEDSADRVHCERKKFERRFLREHSWKMVTVQTPYTWLPPDKGFIE
jgi:hypothetical protein